MIKFKPNITSVVECFILLSFSSYIFSCPYIFKLGNLIKISSIIPGTLIAWYAVRKIFIIIIYINENNIYMKYGPFKYILRAEKMRVCYENIFVFSGSIKPEYGLVLYREISRITEFTLNNKFILTYEIDDVKMVFYKKEFESQLNIKICVVDELF